MLLAIDGNQRIISANRGARTSLMLDDCGLRVGTNLWAIFERDVDLFRRQDRGDISARLLIAGSNDSRPALVTPPEPTSASSNPTNRNLHTRPRSIDISTLPATTPAHGGLSPGAMRRVREYVEMHLGETIDLLMLAGVARLSVHHFARQFKQSAGVTPHAYLTQKRVNRAQEMFGSDGSLVSGNCIRCGLFRPESPSASFPPFARYYPSRVSVVATLETKDVLSG
jgi:AraC-like DNA-binding protein